MSIGFVLAAVLLSSSIFVSACVHVPLSARASFRADQYLSTHPELPPSILKAIQDGHVVTGMDSEQVRAVLGTPLRTAVFGREQDIEVWIYPGHRLHQDQLRGDKAWMFRLVLINGILTIIEPI